MIKFFFYFLTCLAANPFDSWVDHNKDIIKETIKSVSFQIRLESGLDAKEDNILNGQIIVGEKKQFRFEIGTRTIVSDGILWKSFDERTGQIFIQDSDKKLEKVLFSWVKVNKLKALPIQNMPNGSCKIKFFGANNDVRAYFNSETNGLDSILISERDGF